MPKKTPRNSFYYFMLDFKAREEKTGTVFSGMSEVANAAGPEWQNMTPGEKRQYEAKAKDHKHSGRIIKYTSLGEDVEVVTKRMQAVVEAKKVMEAYIERLVADGAEYVSRVFLVASVNHYCFCTSQTYYRHIPAELSIVRFSLESGFDPNSIYHAIYDPGRLPMGYFLAAKKTSEESHQIPLPPHEGSISEISSQNCRETMETMMKFLKNNHDGHGNPDDTVPVVYVDAREIDMAKDIFKHFLIDNGYDDDQVKVYSLPHLFYVLRNAARIRKGMEPAFPFASIADTELDRDIFDYCRGISCEYHGVTEAYPFCTMSKAIRRIFLICDHCCYDLEIPLVGGLHMPENVDPAKLNRPAPIAASTSVSNEEESVACSLPPPPSPSSVSFSDRMRGLTIAPAPDIAEQSLDEPGPSRLRRPFTTSRVMGDNNAESVPPSGRGRGRI